jgi:hypothetical protein
MRLDQIATEMTIKAAPDLWLWMGVEGGDS